MPLMETLDVGRKKRTGPPAVIVKIYKDVYQQAKLVATHRGIPLAELLTEMLRKPVATEHARMIETLSRAVSPDPDAWTPAEQVERPAPKRKKGGRS
jgi:hypothetical protein